MKKHTKQRDDFRFEVANLITEARYHYNLTQTQLARKMGTQQPSIARIERGSTLPSLSFLEKLAESLGTYLVAPKFGFMEESVKNMTLSFGLPEPYLSPFQSVTATLSSFANDQKLNNA